MTSHAGNGVGAPVLQNIVLFNRKTLHGPSRAVKSCLYRALRSATHQQASGEQTFHARAFALLFTGGSTFKSAGSVIMT